MKRIGFLWTFALAVGACGAGGYPFRPAEMTNVTVTAGFWLPRFETNRLVTVWADFRKSEEARIPNFKNAASRSTIPMSTRSSRAPPTRCPPIPTRSSRSILTT